MVPWWFDYALLAVWFGILCFEAVRYRRSGASGPRTWMGTGLCWLAFLTLRVSEEPPVTRLVPEWVVWPVTAGLLAAGGYVWYRASAREESAAQSSA